MKESKPQGKAVLIDGHSLIYRAFYALPTLTTASGEHTNAVLGFAMMLNRLVKEEAPDYLAVAYDLSGPTFRHETFSDYKKERPPMADELRSQIPLVKELVKAFGIPAYALEGFEADDVIGTLSREAEERGCAVLIVTGDMDALQLVSERVSALITRRGIRDLERFGHDEVKERLGVAPSQVADLKGLTGEKSDNIPGVPGIGPKTAVRLLSEYESLERLLESVDSVKGKAGALLKEHAEQARVSKELAVIDRHVPIVLNWDELTWSGADQEALRSLYRRLEFRRLLDELEPPEQERSERSADGPDRPEVSEDPLPVTLITDPDELDTAWAHATEAERVALLPVLDGSFPHDTHLVGWAWGTKDGAVYVPLGHDKGKNASLQSLRQLRPLLVETEGRGEHGDSEARSESPKYVCHDVKGLHALAAAHELTIKARVDDVMLQGYLCVPGQGDYSLEDLSLKFGVGEPPMLQEAKSKTPLAALEPSEVSPRVAGRCRTLLSLAERLEGRIDEDGLKGVYETVELPLAPIIADMEREGIRIDARQLREMAAQMQEEITRLEEEIHTLAGERFNINSPKQLAQILFERLGLPVVSKTKSGPSTSADVLEQLALEHEIAAKILEYRQVQKLKSTYVDALPALVHNETGRIHTTFNQVVAATGRLSSQGPNLQNIPVRTEQGRRIRRVFVPKEGFALVKADYSQIELRVLAHISEDEELVAAFRAGMDIHQKTAAEIFGVDPDEVSGAQRSAAKAVNFGIVYGISSFGLARDTGLSRSEAQAFIDTYFERYAGVARYMKEVVKEARERGYVTTLRGRRRYLPDLTSRKWAVRNFAERTAINTPIQGSAADLIKAAMISVDARIQAESLEAYLLLQVHDELLFEAVPGDVPALARLLKEEMEGVESLRVPLVVEVQSGPNWLDQEPVLLE